MATVYWIFWIISLLLFILSYCISSCKYKALDNGYCVFPNVELSKENPKLRKKIPVKLWYIIVGFLLLWLPVANLLASILFFANACPDLLYYEFILPKENKITNLLAKIGNFLNRDITWSL